MKRADLKPGQKVHVEFDAVVGRMTTKGAWVESSAGTTHSIPAEYMTLTDPENWPPQVGDIWELDGVEYVARANRSIRLRGSVVLDAIGVEPNSVYEHDSDRFDDFARSYPTLVRRRGQSDDDGHRAF